MTNEIQCCQTCVWGGGGHGQQNKYKDADTVMESIPVVISQERHLSNAY